MSRLLPRTGLVLCWLAVQATIARAGDSQIEFNRDVRPILSDNCYACHGHDPATREAGLRLDTFDTATEDFGDYQPVEPGDPQQSEVIRRVTSSEDYEVMPPPEHGQRLSEQEIETLKTWIAEGANYQQHWSLTSIIRPEVPKESVRESLPQAEHDTPGKSTPAFDLAIRNPIDAFIQQPLQDTDFDPNSTADPRTLLRRLSFDLTGLPPSTAEVQRFGRNPTYDHYLQLVERKLNSPHFGERMAIHWLDLVRYADTLGYHGDQERSVSPYRDYVIQAFNENKPFDRFTLEQLAGDLLPDADLTTRVASTYNRLNRASGEGGVQPREYLAKYSADRVRTTGSVWLGSTLGCAECHDHKFDPFTTKDFYRFAAFFADIKEQGIVSGANHIELLPVPTEEQQHRKHRLALVCLKTVMQVLQILECATTPCFLSEGLWDPASIADRGCGLFDGFPHQLGGRFVAGE